MKPYPSYKESGVEWMGDIPSGWTPIRNKLLFTITKNLVGESSSDYQLLSLTKKGIILRDMESGKGKFPEKFDTYQAVGKNNLVICLFDIDETPRTIGLSTYDGMITGSYTVVMCKEGVDPKFVYYNYLSIDDVKGLKPYYTGLRKVVRTETFLGLKVQTPPLQEQQQIANYLDQKTQLIDSLMAKTQQKIALLKEQRTAQINQAVTKGLNPGVEMQDSGVEWLGEIPEHWRKIKVKYLGSVNSGDSLESSLIEPEGDFPVYGGNGVMGFFTDFNSDKEILIIGRVGEKCGNVHYEKSKVWVNDNSLIFIPFNNKPISLQYLFHSLTQRALNQLRNQNTQPLITGTLVKKEYTTLPSLQEQKEIVDYLDQKTQLIDSLMEKETQRLDFLKEYRQSLISNVVTGKIDVRKEEKTA